MSSFNRTPTGLRWRSGAGMIAREKKVVLTCERSAQGDARAVKRLAGDVFV
jgi:hypothetical protein